MSPVPGLDLTRLAPRRDAFDILVRGQKRGQQTATLERTDDGWRYVEESELPPMIQQRTEVWLDATGGMRRVAQTGQMMGQEMRIAASYERGHVVAEAVTPSAKAPVHSDQQLAAGVVDDNALLALLPALAPLEVGQAVEWSVFATGKGKAKATRIEMVGREASGSVAAVRLRVVAEDGRQEFLIGEAAPHPILAMTTSGAPMELRRVQ